MRKTLLAVPAALVLLGPGLAFAELSHEEKGRYCRKLKFIAEKAAEAQERGVSREELERKLVKLLKEEDVGPRGIRQSKEVVGTAYDADVGPREAGKRAWEKCWDTLGKE